MGDQEKMATDHGKNKDSAGSIRDRDSRHSPFISNT